MGGINSNVVLMLHCDGSAGLSTLIEHQYGTKLSPWMKLCSITTLGRFGYGQITPQQVSLQYMAFSAPMAMDFGRSMAFTIDFQQYIVTSYQVARTAVIFECTNSTGTSLFRCTVGGYGGDSGPFGVNIFNSTVRGISVVSTGVWQHFAICRNASGAGYIFVNGSKVGSVWLSDYNLSIAGTQSYYWFGRFWGLEHHTAYIDELRITRGVCLWESDFTPPTTAYGPDVPLTSLSLETSNVQPLWVQNEGMQIANRFRYDAVRKIPDMSAAQVRAVLMSAGYTFDPDADHDFDSVSAHSIASVRLYPTITEDDTSDITSVYFSDAPFNGSASMVGIAFTVAKDFASRYDSRIILLIHGEGSDGGSLFYNSADNNITITAISAAITATSAVKWGTTGMRFISDGLSIQAAFVNSLLLLSANDFTIHYWIKFADSTMAVYQVPWAHYVNTSNRFHHTFTSNAMNLAYLSGGANVLDLSTTALASWNNTSWFHICTTRSGTILRLYKDGSLIASTSFTGDMFAQSGRFALARYDGTQYALKGFMDEFVILKSVVLWTSTFTLPTSAELQSQYYSGETIIGFLSIDTTIPSNEIMTAKGVSVRLT
jgi:hypothetical protein